MIPRAWARSQLLQTEQPMREAEIRARGGLARPSEVWLAVVRIYVIGAAFRTVLTGRGCAGTKCSKLVLDGLGF